MFSNTVDKSKRQEFLVQVITTGTVGDSWVAAAASAASAASSTTALTATPSTVTTLSTATLGWQPLLLGGAAVSLV